MLKPNLVNPVAVAADPPEDDVTDKVQVRELQTTFVSGTESVCALDGVEFDIKAGEFVSLIGPSGCGKSTILRILAGLETPTQGSVRISRSNPDEASTGVVFQNYSILPWKTVEANVAFGLRLRGMPRKQAFEEARGWIQRMGLHGFEKKYPGTLSGGMKQRVAVARAFALNPAVLLLDEPFAALDAQRRDLMQEELLAQWQTQGNDRGALLVTHSLDEAILLGDRVLLMGSRPGKIVNSWEVPFERPRSPEMRASREFGELRDGIWSELREQVRKTL